ncbi:MAG: hypothetical protein MUP41_11080 [Desulfobacterales bacterium]|nr:hypothetical protein [Desulfobacterales bacterium]
MEEKFYYAKRFFRGTLIFGIVISIITVVMSMFEEGLLFIISFVCCVTVAVNSFWVAFRVKDKPAIIITNNKIVFGPYVVKRVFFGDGRKLELNFGQIISAGFNSNKKKIIISYRNEDSKNRLFKISLDTIENYERLIGILKQRIKFV